MSAQVNAAPEPNRNTLRAVTVEPPLGLIQKLGNEYHGRNEKPLRFVVSRGR